MIKREIRKRKNKKIRKEKEIKEKEEMFGENVITSH